MTLPFARVFEHEQFGQILFVIDTDTLLVTMDIDDNRCLYQIQYSSDELARKMFTEITEANALDTAAKIYLFHTSAASAPHGAN